MKALKLLPDVSKWTKIVRSLHLVTRNSFVRHNHMSSITWYKQRWENGRWKTCVRKWDRFCNIYSHSKHAHNMSITNPTNNGTLHYFFIVLIFPCYNVVVPYFFMSFITKPTQMLIHIDTWMPHEVLRLLIFLPIKLTKNQNFKKVAKVQTSFFGGVFVPCC